MQENEQIEGFRLSPQQRRLWQTRRGGAAARAEAVARVSGALDAETLRAAASCVVARHEILRTTFRQLPGMDVPLQVILE